MSLSVKEILNIGRRQLAQADIADAAIDSKILYCFMMNITSSQLMLEYQKTLQDSLCDEYFNLLERRCSGIPVQYITGTQEFMGLEFNVNENVLIPRLDTELFVEDAVSIINQNKLRNENFAAKAKKSWDVLDLCCGSGAIGVSIAKLCANAKVTCCDVSGEAVAIAKENADKLGVSKKVNFEIGNLMEPFKGKFKNKKFDMIISNPPYIKTDVIPTLQREIKDHEPVIALDGGEDGLDFYRTIINDAVGCLKKNGVLMFEIGSDQKDDVVELLEATGRFEKITDFKDLAGMDRIIVAVLAKVGKKNT